MDLVVAPVSTEGPDECPDMKGIKTDRRLVDREHDFSPDECPDMKGIKTSTTASTASE